MRKKKETKKQQVARLQREKDKRWDIIQRTKDDEWLVQQIDMAEPLRAGGNNNFSLVSPVAVDFLDEQPETRVPGVVALIKVAALRHRTGIVGGVGSPELANAETNLNQVFKSFTTQQQDEARKAADIVIKHMVKQFPTCRMDQPADNAATPEEVRQFYIEQRRVPTAVAVKRVPRGKALVFDTGQFIQINPNSTATVLNQNNEIGNTFDVVVPEGFRNQDGTLSCECHDHTGHTGPIVLRSLCHFTEPLKVMLVKQNDDGKTVLHGECSVCDKTVVNLLLRAA